VADAVRAAVRIGASAVLFNCSRPEVMAPAVAQAREVTGVEIGVYANAFEPGETEIAANDGNGPMREDLDAERYLAFSRRWVELGATIVGGCCGIGPRHIACLSAHLHAAKPLHG
jgi:S-methylmethionine-dependent homocysteine/selenocysteine methylase